MEMARAVTPRLKKIGSIRELPLLEPLKDWSPAQIERLTETVKKVTDGKTQSDFLMELGVAKKPQASGLTGGARAKNGEAPCDPNTKAAVAKDSLYTPLRKIFQDDWKAHWLHLPDAESRELFNLLAGAVTDLKDARKAQSKDEGE